MTTIKERILTELESAKKSIIVAVAWLTDQELISMLLEKAKEKKSVHVIVSSDEWNVIRYYQLQQLSNAGAKILTFGPSTPFEYNFMHCKYCVVDKYTVLEGSYNWTVNAQSNKENIRIAKDFNRAIELTSHFNEMAQESISYFQTISNPDLIIGKYELLEKAKAHPCDSEVRKKIDKTYTQAKLINKGDAHTTEDGKITSKPPKKKVNKPHKFYGGIRYKSS